MCSEIVLAAPTRKAPIKIVPKTASKQVVKKVKPQFPRLSDPDKQEDLQEEYGHILEQAGEWSNIATYLQTYLQAGFTTQPFFTFSHPTNFIMEGKDEPGSVFYEKWTEKFQQLNAKSIKNNIFIDGDVASFALESLEVDVKFDYGSDVPEENIEGITKTFRKIFPEWSIPTAIQRNDDDGMAVMLVKKPYMTDFESSEEVMDIRFDVAVPPNRGYIPEDTDYDSDSGETAAIKKTLSVRFRLAPMQTPATVVGAEDRIMTSHVQSATAHTRIFIDAKIEIPLEMALWMTHAKTREEFIPALAVNHLKGVVKEGGAEGEWQRVMSMETINDHNAKVQKEYNYIPKRRTNKDGFTITSSCAIMYIPDNVNPAAYNNLLRSLYDQETGEIKSVKKVPELASIPVNVDWMNDTYSYTNSDGELIHERIRGSIPLDDVTIGRYLRHDISEPFGAINSDNEEYMHNAKEMLDMFLRMGAAACVQLDLYKRYAENPDYVLRSFSGLYNTICVMYPNKTVGQVFSANAEPAEGVRDASLYTRVFAEYCRAISDNIMNIHGSSVNTLAVSKFLFHLFGYYATSSEDYRKIFHDARRKNNTIGEMDRIPGDNFKLPALPGVKSLMYHQAQIAEFTANDPELITLDVQPGGGKTLSTIVSIVQYKMKNPNKRVGLIVPDILVKEWYTSITNFSQNQINCFPLTTDIIEKMVGNMKLDRSKVLAYLQKAPANTIFVVGMNLLTLKRDVFDRSKKLPYIQYGDSIVEVYPNTLFMRQLKLDKLFIDESQRAKNESTTIARSIRQVRSEVEGGGILSGTLVGNIGTDLVSQFALNHPMILRNHDQFINRYGIIENGKFIDFKKDSNVLLRNDSQAYTLWLQKTRADWAYVLPKIMTQYYECTLTPNQQKWNNTLIDEAVEEILKDPQIRKLLESAEDDDAAQAKLENAIKAHLARVEIFINAPDERPNPLKTGKPALFFADTQGIEPKDLVSPKVAYMNRIVYHHFNGGEFVAPDGSKPLVNGRPVVFKKQKAKVIIFCYHKAVTEHVFRHFKVPGINAVKYQAGDDSVITRFKEDPNVHVLIASENSLREGLNLQVASRVIRVETLWTDGAEEQAISRVMRPDVEDKYQRTEINVDTLLMLNTMEVAKRARLISKIVSNRRIKSFDEKFHKYLDDHNIRDLKIIRMDLKNIRVLFNSRMSLHQYYDAQSAIESW